MTYGDVSTEELFKDAIGRAPLKDGLATIRSKTSFIEVVLPPFHRLDIFLRHLRSGKRDKKFKEVYDTYWNPHGPALAFVCGYKTRLKAFRDTGQPTPSNMVLFVGTSII